MKKLLFSAMLVATALTLASCGGKTTGPANEVLSKKAFSAAIAKYADVGDFNDGVAIVKVEDGWRYKSGVINNKGEEIVACNYTWINPSSCGMMLFRDENGLGFMNSKGEVMVASGKYDDAEDYSDNLACVKKDGKVGFVDVKGNEVIPCSFERAYPFAEGLALVRKNDKYGYINTKAEFVVAPAYDDGYHFACGVAIVEKGSKEYVIDKEGTVVFSQDGNKSAFLEEQFSDNLIPVIKEQGRKMVVGYMNTTGEEIIPFEYQYGSGFEDGNAVVMKDNKVYNINTKGEILGEVSSSEILIDFLDDAKYYIDLTSKVLIDLLGEDVYEDEWDD